jgi:hypothetical protein
MRRTAASRPFVYLIDLDERGVFKAHVTDPFGKVVLGIDTEDDPSFFEDGWVRHGRDIEGIRKYLVHLGVMRATDALYDSEARAEAVAFDPDSVEKHLRACEIGAGGGTVYEQSDGSWRDPNGAYVWPSEQAMRDDVGHTLMIYDPSAEERDQDDVGERRGQVDPGGFQQEWLEQHENIKRRIQWEAPIRLHALFDKDYSYWGNVLYRDIAEYLYPELTRNDPKMVKFISDVFVRTPVYRGQSRRNGQVDPGGLQDDWIESVRSRLMPAWEARCREVDFAYITQKPGWIDSVRAANARWDAAVKAVLGDVRVVWDGHTQECIVGDTWHFPIPAKHKAQALHQTPGLNEKDEGEVPKSIQPAPVVCRIPLSRKDLERQKKKELPPGLSIAS